MRAADWGGLRVLRDLQKEVIGCEGHSIRMIDRATGKIELTAGTGKKGDGAAGDPLKCEMACPAASTPKPTEASTSATAMRPEYR